MRVVIVEDHAAVRASLALLLRRSNIEIVGDASDAPSGQRRIRELRPDVALIDISLDGDDGIELAEELSRTEPSVGILLYTGVDSLAVLGKALECGARGVAMKAGEPTELVEAIQTVASGGHYVDPRIPGLLAQRKRPAGDPRFSRREREVVQLLAQGMSGTEIAEQLVLSPDTVRTHVRNAMERCGAHTRAHLIALALRDQEILPPARQRPAGA